MTLFFIIFILLMDVNGFKSKPATAATAAIEPLAIAPKNQNKPLQKPKKKQAPVLVPIFSDKKISCIHPNLNDGKKQDLTKLPRSTNIYCWQDSHPFTGTPFFMCSQINNDLEEYSCNGFFCSISCVLTYLIERSNNRSDMLHMNTLQMYERQSRMIPETKGQLFKPRFSKNYLKIFGGTMSIEEYRSKTL